METDKKKKGFLSGCRYKFSLETHGCLFFMGGLFDNVFFCLHFFVGP